MFTRRINPYIAVAVTVVVYLAILVWLHRLTLQNISWIFSAGSILGAFAVSSLKRWGLIIWLVANSGWLIYDLHQHEYSQVVIFAFFITSNVYGLIRWKSAGVG